MSELEMLGGKPYWVHVGLESASQSEHEGGDADATYSPRPPNLTGLFVNLVVVQQDVKRPAARLTTKSSNPCICLRMAIPIHIPPILRVL